MPPTDWASQPPAACSSTTSGATSSPQKPCLWPPSATPTLAPRSTSSNIYLSRGILLNAKSTRNPFQFSRRRPTLPHRATEGDCCRRGRSRGEKDVPLQSFHLSRACSRHRRGARWRDHQPRARPALLRDVRRTTRHGLALLRQADEDVVQRHPDLFPDVGPAAGLQDGRSLHDV